METSDLQDMKEKISKIFWALILILGVTSCSYRQIIFDFHSFFATRAAVRFFDLSSEQKKVFEERWQVFSRSIAENKLPQILTELEKLGQSPDPAAVMGPLEGVSAEIMSEACRSFSPVLADLSPAQIKHLADKLRDRNSKFDPEKQGGLSKYRESRAEEMFSTIKNWFGRITDSQKELIRTLEAEKYSSNDLWEVNYLLYSRDAQDVILSIMQKNLGHTKKMEQSCLDYIRTPEFFLSEQSKLFKGKLSGYRQIMLREIFKAMEPDQRRHLIEELTKLVEELRAWSRGL